MKKIIQILSKVIIVLLLILTFVFAYLSIFHKDLILTYLDMFKNFVHSLGYWNYVIILIFWFIESFPLLGVAVPGQLVLIIIAGALWYEWMYLAMICASLGAILWNYVWYKMWVAYWDSFFDKYWPWIWVMKTDIKYIKKWIDKHWWLFVILWKFHNMFRAFVPFIAGSSSMHSFKFTVSNIIGSILRWVSMVFIGIVFVNNAEVILENIGKFILWLVLLFFAYIYFFKKEEFKKYWDEKNKEMEEMINKWEVNNE